MGWPKGVKRKGYKKKTSFKTIVKDAQKAIRSNLIAATTPEEIKDAINKAGNEYVSMVSTDFFPDNFEHLNPHLKNTPTPLGEAIEVIEIMESQGFFYAKTGSGKKFWIDTNTGSFKMLDNSTNEPLFDSNEDTRAVVSGMAHTETN